MCIIQILFTCGPQDTCSCVWNFFSFRVCLVVSRIMADCGNTLCCVGCIGEAIPRPAAIACLIVFAPILLIVGIILTAQCAYEGPYFLIAGALLCGLVVFLLYPIRQTNTNKYTRTNSSETERIYKTNKCTHIIVGCIWIFIVLPSIITAIILLTSYPCFTTNWRRKKCIVKDINAIECSSFFGGDGYYYLYVLILYLKYLLEIQYG